ncbi:MAG: SGNH/GDSL hydrolase family protein [Candidatus Nanopelagicaceae bacterium]
MKTAEVAPFLTFAVIGDSAAFGTGDSAPDGSFRGWTYYLANSFHDKCNYVNLSRPGAKSEEVSTSQLIRAKALAPDICAVVAGGNDLLRNGFSPQKLYLNLQRTCKELMELGSEVIMVELHDPNQLLKIPKVMKRILRNRVESVNAVYRALAEELEIILIKTREIPDVHNLKNWHIDRMHPGELGHKLLAREVATQLQMRGWLISLPEEGEIIIRERSAQIKWLIANGLPWFLKRSVDLLPVVLILSAIEIVKIIFEKISSLNIHQSQGSKPGELLKLHDRQIVRNSDQEVSYR